MKLKKLNVISLIFACAATFSGTATAGASVSDVSAMNKSGAEVSASTSVVVNAPTVVKHTLGPVVTIDASELFANTTTIPGVVSLSGVPDGSVLQLTPLGTGGQPAAGKAYADIASSDSTSNAIYAGVDYDSTEVDGSKVASVADQNAGAAVNIPLTSGAKEVKYNVEVAVPDQSVSQSLYHGEFKITVNAQLFTA